MPGRSSRDDKNEGKMDRAIPPGDEALTVPRDWVVVFDYGGRGWLGSVDAGAYPLDRGKGSLSGGTSVGT